MSMFEKIAGLTIRYWKRILLVMAGLVLVSGYFSKKLFDNLQASWIDMVPQHAASVKAYKDLIRDFPSASGIIVTVRAKERWLVEQAVAAAGPRLAAQTNIFHSVFYRNNPAFMGRFALFLQKEKDLKRNSGFLTRTGLVHFLAGINDSLEAEYVGNADNMKHNENDVAMFLSGLEDLAAMIHQAARGMYLNALVGRNAAFFSSGPQYLLSPDGTMGLITITPSVSVNDINGAVRIADALDAILQNLEKQFPGVEFGQTGMHTLTRDEMRTMNEDSMVVTILAFVIILVFLIAAFRMKSAPALGMLTLIAGVVISLGVAWFVIGSLNIMTAMVGAILMGLGIDYAIHLLSRFTEAREAGSDAPDAIRVALRDSGRGLLTGALTTAAAFGILILIPFKGLAELGLITAIGIITCVLTSIFLLPSLLMLREWMLERKKNRKVRKNRLPMRYTFLATLERKINRKPLLTVLVLSAFTVWMAFQLPKAVFSGDLKEIEMKGLKSLALNDAIKDKFDMTSDSVFIVTSSMEEDRRFRKILEDNPQISMIESPSLYIPSSAEQQQRTAVLRQIAARLTAYTPPAVTDRSGLAKQLLRLKANLLEIRDMAYMSGLDRVFKRTSRILGGREKKSKGILDNAVRSLLQGDRRYYSALNHLNRNFSAALKRKILPLTHVTGITPADLPTSIRNRVFSRDGKKGLLTAWLMKDNWAKLHESPFLDNLVKTTQERVTGMILFMRDLVHTASSAGERATFLSLTAILLIVLLDFRSLKMGGLAFFNLVAVVVSMTGLFILLGEKFNFVNVLALPILIGIGIDDSVHIIHRYRAGDSLQTVLSSTGRGILLTSLTTMVGFGSLAFARYQGLKSFGIVLFCGVGIALVYSVLLLPALIRLFPGKGRRAEG